MTEGNNDRLKWELDHLMHILLQAACTASLSAPAALEACLRQPMAVQPLGALRARLELPGARCAGLIMS